MSTRGRNTNQNLAKPGEVSGLLMAHTCLGKWAGLDSARRGSPKSSQLQTLRPQAPGTGLPQKTLLPDLMLDWGDWFFQKEALAPHFCQLHHDHCQSNNTHKQEKLALVISPPPFPNTRPYPFPLTQYSFPKPTGASGSSFSLTKKTVQGDASPSSRPTGDLQLGSLFWL